LMAVVAGAVNAAHEADVLHRDIKPSNILLSNDGIPKVADFGLAKRTDRDDGMSLCSGPIGTASFMPPEQISRKYGELGPASDVYGLGATLYFLLTGHPPFTGDSSHDIALKVTTESVVPLRAIRSDVPVSLEAIVMKSLEKNPNDRYSTAAELAADLNRFLKGIKQQAPRFTLLRRARRWLGKKKSWLVGSAAAFAVLLGLLWLKIIPGAPLPKVQAELRIEERDVIRKEIAAGKLVKLLNADGQPRWSDWPMEPAKLVGSPDDGGTCSFGMEGSAVLLVLDDPGVDRYRVSLEVCERTIRGPLGFPPLNTIDPHVGLVLSFAIQPGNVPNFNVSSMEMIGYSELYKNGNAVDQHVIALWDLALVRDKPVLPGGLFKRQQINVPIQPILPAPTWRKIVAEVAPEGLIMVEPKCNRPYLANELRKERGELAKTLARSKAKLGQISDWSPRMPIGIWCLEAEIAVRNLTIEAVK